MKKLLIVTDTYFPKSDGVVTFLSEVVPRLKSKFDITILAPNLGYGREIAETVKLDISKKIKISGYNAMKLSLKNFRRIKELVKENDIIFAQDVAFIGSLAIRYARRYKKKIVSFFHQNIWYQYEQLVKKNIWKKFSRLFKLIAVNTYNKCDMLIVPYKSLAEELNNAGIYPKKEVVNLGLDLNHFSPSKDKDSAKQNVGFRNKDFVIGYVGRISQEKNLGTLLNAFLLLKKQHRNLKMLIVGGGEEKIIKKFDFPDIKVTGFVNDVIPYLHAMDVFVMPSLTETTSLATLEAMACGIPVIVTKVGFMKEYVIRNYSGYFFQRLNPSLLAEKINRLILNKRLRQIMGQNAYSTVINRFSWNKAAKEIANALNKVQYL